MKCAILAVGTELLFGHTVNTDAVYLSQQLNLMGIDVLYHHTVGDNPGRLKEVLQLALKHCDLVMLAAAAMTLYSMGEYVWQNRAVLGGAK